MWYLKQKEKTKLTEKEIRLVALRQVAGAGGIGGRWSKVQTSCYKINQF